MFKKARDQHGFTLIELLVIISIIGLLSSVVLASTKAAIDKAVNAKKLSLAREYIKALDLYYNENGKYLFGNPHHPRCLGVGNPTGSCFFNPVAAEDNDPDGINDSIKKFIPGPPASTDSVNIDGENYSGLGYECLFRDISGDCTAYDIYWVMRGIDTKCAGGFVDQVGNPADDGNNGATIFANNSFCVYTNDLSLYNSVHP